MSYSIGSPILDALLPPLCVGCHEEGFYLCKKCKDDIKIYQYFICPVCKKRNPDGKISLPCSNQCKFRRFFGCPLLYKDPLVSKTLQVIKYNKVKNILPDLSEILIDFLENNQFAKIINSVARDKIYVSPTPLHNFKLRDRGFNQSEEIAKAVAEHFAIKFFKNALLKTKMTDQQADIKDEEKRRKNIAGVFKINKNAAGAIAGKIILLVDDVYTTGATMRECALVLRQAGAKEVWGVALCRG